MPGPDVPVLVSPADGGYQCRCSGDAPVADRGPGNGIPVAGCHIQYVRDGHRAWMIPRSPIRQQVLRSLTGKTTYYWRVSGRNATGASAFSATRSFVTGLALPLLTAPADGATGRQQPVLLTWSAVSGATGYHVQVSSESGFSSGLVVDDAAVDSDPAFRDRACRSSTLYYWRVAARDAGGDGAYSNARTFTTAVASPALISPADNATNQPLTLTLSWSALAGATFYHVQVATDAGFTSGVILDDSGVTSTSLVSVRTCAEHTVLLACERAAMPAAKAPSRLPGRSRRFSRHPF